MVGARSSCGPARKRASEGSPFCPPLDQDWSEYVTVTDVSISTGFPLRRNGL